MGLRGRRPEMVDADRHVASPVPEGSAGSRLYSVTATAWPPPEPSADLPDGRRGVRGGFPRPARVGRRTRRRCGIEACDTSTADGQVHVAALQEQAVGLELAGLRQRVPPSRWQSGVPPDASCLLARRDERAVRHGQVTLDPKPGTQPAPASGDRRLGHSATKMTPLPRACRTSTAAVPRR